MKIANKIILIVALCSRVSGFSQGYEIKWNTIPLESIDPEYLIGEGRILLNNGQTTPASKILVDFKNKYISYYRTDYNDVFKMTEDDFQQISLREFNGGVLVNSKYFLQEVPDAVGASLRKKLYYDERLNQLVIRTVVKEGLFQRKKPDFELDSNGEVIVTNGVELKSKLLAIGPNEIYYLDAEGDLWLRKPNKVRGVDQTGGSKEDEARKRRAARKQARVLNLKFGDSLYPNIGELYNYIFSIYKQKAAEAIIQFKKDLIGQPLDFILSKWGPFTRRELIDAKKFMLVWSWEERLTETNSSSKTVSSGINVSVESEVNSSQANSYNDYDTYSKSNIYSSGADIVVDSYSTISGKGYLDYYSKSISTARSYEYSSSLSNSFSQSVETDISRHVALIVNNENIIEEVILNNYFPDPQWGTFVSFYY